VSWQPICGLGCREGGPCSAREQQRRARFVAEHAEDDRNLLSDMLTTANRWRLVACCCELAASDPRRSPAARLLRGGGWLVSGAELSDAEQEVEMAVLVDVAATLAT
jgi:hypothetical protein